MFHWLKIRFGIIRLTLQNPALLMFLGLLILAPIVLGAALPANLMSYLPWYAWGMGWLALLWFASIEYSLQRKEVFDQTSSAFFKAYLDHLIREGHGLFRQSEDKDFHLKIGDWQRQAVQGIAIGLGPEESRNYFQKIDSQNPLTDAYKESLNLHSSEPLCRTLQGNLEELEIIRVKIAGPKALEAGQAEDMKTAKQPRETKLLTGPK
jgi:hypothetical protein